MARFGFLPLVFGLACFVGCTSDGNLEFLGYTTRPPFDPSITRIYIPHFENFTYMRGMEFQLKKALIEEINRRPSPMKITMHRDQADAELIGKIVSRRKQVILYNQQLETRDAELQIGVEMSYLDLRPGRQGLSLLTPEGQKRVDRDPLEPIVIDPKNPPVVLITPTTTYIPELGGSNASAEAYLARQLAKQVVNMMESYR